MSIPDGMREYLGNSQWAMLTKLTGSIPTGANKIGTVGLSNKTVEVITHNGVAVRDTANQDGVGFIDVSGYGRKMLHILNLLDQSVTVTIQARANAVANTVTIVTKTIGPGVFEKLNSADSTALTDPYQQWRIRATCSVAPASGSLSIYFEGDPK